MGCNKGEIELGFLNMSQVDIQAALRSLFPEDFSRQSQQIDQNPPSSSSSSLRSISTGSPEYSSLLFSTIQGTSQPHFPETLGAVVPPMQPVPNTASSSPHMIQTLPQVPPTQFPTLPESEHDAIMRAILNIISHPPNSSLQNLPSPEASSSFQRYRPDHNVNIGPNLTPQIGSNFRRQSLMKRSFSFFRTLNLMRMRERIQATSRPTNTQLHHMISERRRREKLNENFQALRALLPPGTKDKASILTTAKETLRSLMAEVEKLSKLNLELTSAKESKGTESSITKAMISSSNERINVAVSHVPESSSSQERMVDLQVNVRTQISQIDVLIRLLEFLKRAHHVTLVSMDAHTITAQGNDPLHQLTFRLRIIQGSEWDEATFEEAVRRVVADLIQYQVDH